MWEQEGDFDPVVASGSFLEEGYAGKVRVFSRAVGCLAGRGRGQRRSCRGP